MAEKKFNENDREFIFFADFYNYIQKFWIAEPTEEYLRELVEATDQMAEKYPGKLAASWMADFISWQEGNWIELRKAKLYEMLGNKQLHE